jgi:hypothetical protein
VTRFAHELRSPTESDEYTNVYYVTDPPRKRDFFRVLFGRYTPQVRRVERLTVKGMHHELKRTWTSDAMREQFYGSPLLDGLP